MNAGSESHSAGGSGSRPFEGRIAVVTGGASGIGRSCAEVFAARGARVVVADIDSARAEAVAESVGGMAFPIDVGFSAGLEVLAERIEHEVGPADMLVNAAGIIQGEAVRPEELPIETYDRVFDVNLRGTYASCVAFGRRMAIRRRGAKPMCG